MLCCKCNGPLRHEKGKAAGKFAKRDTFAPDGRTEKGRNFPELFNELPWDISPKIANCSK